MLRSAHVRGFPGLVGPPRSVGGRDAAQSSRLGGWLDRPIWKSASRVRKSMTSSTA